MDKLVLVRLPADFSNLRGNLNDNFTKISEFVATTCQLINDQELTRNWVSFSNIDLIPDVSLNRAFRLTMMHGFSRAWDNLDGLLKVFNGLMFYDDTDMPATMINLVIPQTLDLDAAIYNDCWDVLEGAMNKIISIETVNELTE